MPKFAKPIGAPDAATASDATTTVTTTDTSTTPATSHRPEPGGAGHRPGTGDAEVFSFTIEDGIVTSGSITLPTGETKVFPANDSITLSVSGEGVTATRTTDGSVEQLYFTDADADGLYAAVAQSHVFTSAPATGTEGPHHRSTVTATLDSSGTAVESVTRTAVQGPDGHQPPSDRTAIDATHAAPTRPELTEAWSVSSEGLLVYTATTTEGSVHWEVYRDGNADGVYTEVASGSGDLIALAGVVTLTDGVATSL